MKKYILGFSIGLLMLALAASALAFSVSLQQLRVNAASFVQPIVSPFVGAPMTSNDESQIGQNSSDPVRFAEFDSPRHICEKNKTGEQSAGF